MPPLLSSFKKLFKVENLVDLVKQISINCDLNMEGLGRLIDISNKFDAGVRSNEVDDHNENNKNGNASSVQKDYKKIKCC